MRRLFITLTGIIFAVSGWLCALPKPAVGAESTPKGQYTILVYMNGSDLESKGAAATKDLAEMLAAGSTDQVNVLVETLGTRRWNPKFISSTRNQRWRVGKGKLELVDDSLGRQDVADPATLTAFIRWGMANYPAERYALLFWNHGGGAVGGYGKDETNSGNPSLGLEGIKQGIADALAGTGERLELVGFDTCLLATTELASSLSPYARYFVASEELEPGHGWFYTPVLKALGEDPNMSGLQIGRLIADNFQVQAVQMQTEKMITLAVIDLDQIQPVVQTLQDFLTAAGQVTTNPEQLLLLQKARFEAEAYGANADMVDLADFISGAAALAPEKAGLVLAAVKKAVLYRVNGLATPRASGLSIYFPKDGKIDLDSRLARYEQIGFSPAYRNFVSNYAETAFDAAEPIAAPLLLPAKTAGVSGTSRFAAQILAADVGRVAEVYAYRATYSDEYNHWLSIISTDYNVNFDPTTGRIEYSADHRGVSLNGHRVNMKLINLGADFDRYAIPILLNDRPVSLIVLYNNSTGAAEIVGAWPGIDTESDMAIRELIRIIPGDRVRPLLDGVVPALGEDCVLEGEEFVVKGKLDLDLAELPPGQYLDGFIIVDWTGNRVYTDPEQTMIEYEEGYEIRGEYWEADHNLPPIEAEPTLGCLTGETEIPAKASTPRGTGEIRLFVNCKPVSIELLIGNQPGRILAPLGTLLALLGASGHFDAATQTVTATRDNIVVELKVNAGTALVNGQVIEIDQPAVVSSAQVMIPVRLISEAFGADVLWNEASLTVSIDIWQ